MIVTGTSFDISPPVISVISFAGIVPSVTNVSGRSHRWLWIVLRPVLPPTTSRPTSFDSCVSVIGWCVPRATR